MPRPAAHTRPPRPTVVRQSPLALAAAAALAAATLAPRPARAQLLVSPTGGSGVTTTALTPLLSNPDDAVVVRPFADSFTFYGVARRAVAVSTNGYLQFGGDVTYARSADRALGELASDVGAPTAAVLYDDFVFDDSSSLLEHIAPGHYQAYTFADVLGYYDRAINVEKRSTFQVAFFTGATRIGAVDFGAGDVAYSYGPLEHTIQGGTASVGVARDGRNVTVMGEDGQIDDLAQLPTGAGRFVLLWPNAAGSYDLRSGGGLITVPEPSSAALVAAGLGAAWAARRRRRA